MLSYVQEAFNKVCAEALRCDGKVYVSLYAREPFYGGPEEGGWWGHDDHLVAYQEFPNEEAAEVAKEKVQVLADELSAEAKKDFGERCKRECEWLEERGLDADYLPEPDGETEYYVTIETDIGSLQSRGCRHYE